MSSFLLYGSTGFVGDAIARLAVEQGLRPVLAGRNPGRVEAQAAELDLEHHAFGLDNTTAIDLALGETTVVLNCAGPFMHTFEPMVEGCLRTGTHYVDITGEIPVYEALAARDAQARAQGVMLLPGAGFDVVPTDCLAVHLKQRLPSATRLTLAFCSRGPAGIPPGTANTMVETLPYGIRVRRNGELVPVPGGGRTRAIDFGDGPIEATLITWGNVFMAYHSTGIPNIEDYAVFPAELVSAVEMVWRYMSPFLGLSPVQSLFKRIFRARAGSTVEERARTRTHVWGEVEDDQGRKATSRLHGPEAGVVWTSRAALACVEQVLSGNAPTGFQTPARAYGADFVMECEGVAREDLDGEEEPAA